MSYSVKEIFYTLQGEGARAGRAAVFLRFAGCNLWTGREQDRHKAVCRFCDTEFVGTDGTGGGVFRDAASLADAVAECWKAGINPPLEGGSNSRSEFGEGSSRAPHPSTPPRNLLAQISTLPQGEGRPYVVCTGGEPLLQLDAPLIEALHAAGIEIAVETNGTLEPPPGIDWICMSPKANADVKLTRGNELKLVYPQDGAPPERYAGLAFDNFFLQPMDSPTREANTRAAVAYCMAHPQWRLSLQTHKMLGIR